MTRPWGKLYAATLISPKFVRMTLEERGAWLTLLLYALASARDDDLGTDADVIAVLRREGCSDPAGMLRRLVELRWIDRKRGRNYLHDWQHWQPADPTGALRKQAWRGRRLQGHSRDGHVTVPGQSRDGHVLEERREEGDTSPLPPSQPERATHHRSNGRESYDELLEHDGSLGLTSVDSLERSTSPRVALEAETAASAETTR